ncbi:response regulator transcription factor [Paenibacillus beijingensis]|uniref:Transcriptional regulator n=1 Tax=Paenibacillus beijingensis TaxID=1126833 RepID=A0A0D5NL27_9BACL|nr:response regulator transcription factor [Paenibacillus beijingensis]AJY75840.1 transcriptional regulator [Paenibacillus beijingensis]
MSKKVLVVDDEPSISRLIEYNLKLAGYEVSCVHDGEAVFQMLRSFRPDLIVLDLMLPGMDGIQVCRELRKQANAVPIVMLTAMHEVTDRIAGLDNGADDYMTKPFSPQELISRIGAVLRRARELPGASPEEDAALEIGRLTLLPSQREVKVNGQPIELTPKEYELLLFLCRHQNRVLSRQQLLHGVWDYHFLGDTRIVDVHISHVRDKIERNPRMPEYIQTVRGVGYKLIAPAIHSAL